MAQTNENVDLKKILAFAPADREVSWNRRDAILYALGVGAEDMTFVYEQAETFSALPTIWSAMSFRQPGPGDVQDFNKSSGSFPGLKFNPAQILHGEEFVELFAPPPTHGTFISRSRVLDFLDKGKGGLLLMETTFHADKSAHSPAIARLVRSSFIRGLGGHGGRKRPQSDPRPKPPPQPSRAPDAVVVRPTLTTQALLYRLSGDYNPLHIDASIAQSVGFERPILHGLCSFGFAAHAVLRAFPGVDVRSVSTRFSSPVLPGDELRVEMWREGAEWILFRVLVGSKVVLSDGFVQIKAPAKL